MHQLIASYLFQNKTCPLPGLGILSVVAGKAESDFLNTTIKAPLPRIIFEAKENDASNLLDYVASKTNSTVLNTIDALGQFCNNLKAAAISNKPAILDGVGNFFTDSSGNINFKSSQLPAVFLQPVKAERVIHPQAEHQILVGDKETTNTVMTEYFNETPEKSSRWWVWAIVLGTFAILGLLYYLTMDKTASAFGGNTTPIQ
ncbi:hypothetical protein [Ferruginibacter sp. SUN106]|uniref:hypothetical protein n=1 Tax=Ferruginibacter sp. SUN106 TaxID=2978348 RepID=UPI003D368BAF